MPETKSYGGFALHFIPGEPSYTITLFINLYILQIRQVSRHNKIMLNYESRLFRIQDIPFDNLRSDNSLFGVQIGAWFID